MRYGTSSPPRALWPWLVGLTCLVLTMAGCAQPATKDIGIGPSDVDHVDVYLYAYSTEPASVTRSIVTDRREIEELVTAFTDMPVTSLPHSASELSGQRAAGLRFFLREGGSVELTQVFVGPRDVAVFWPDGSVVGTTWGSPVGDSGTPSEPSANVSVAPSDRPRAVVP